MAKAIYDGLVSYFNDNPPAGTWLASQDKVKPSVYIVKSGDTLSGISQRYNIRMSSIIKKNKLKKTDVYVGQKLKLP